VGGGYSERTVATNLKDESVQGRRPSASVQWAFLNEGHGEKFASESVGKAVERLSSLAVYRWTGCVLTSPGVDVAEEFREKRPALGL